MEGAPNSEANAKSETTAQPGSQPSSIQPIPDSQTASEFIDSQLQLEADAREALPYSFDNCTQLLGPLRQNVYSCLTCNPAPTTADKAYTSAGMCYGCSIACHGDHTLVELFTRRDFTCDCGTLRFPATQPCTLRIDPKTGSKGPVHSQEPPTGNTYNQNYRNRFCGCGEEYDPHKQKGTMYQCLGLATEQDGGCGEDWWHPECLMGLPRDWYKFQDHKGKSDTAAPGDGAEEDHPVPPGFPEEDDFDTLICYKCAQTAPWIKGYANSQGFLHLKHITPGAGGPAEPILLKDDASSEPSEAAPAVVESGPAVDSKKRKAEDEASDEESSKKVKMEDGPISVPAQQHATLSAPPTGIFSIFTTDDEFRDRFCRCAECYSTLSKYPQLLEEEESYEPPVSEEGDGQNGGSVGTGSLLDRGEAALSNVDRVRAIEGVMVYNHLKDKVKSFLQPFAQSGQAVGAEDIKAYFEKLRGDSEAIKAAGGAAIAGGDGPDGDSRHKQSGY